MTHESPSEWPIQGPIDLNWTIPDLLQRLCDDACLDRALCADLAPIEAAASSAAGAASWRSAPGAVALIRSLAELQRAAPELSTIPLRALLAGDSERSTPSLQRGQIAA